MTPLFGEFQVRVDPWAVDYGSETPLAPSADQPDEDALDALEVELPLDRWTHLRPGPVSPPSRLYFTDGVRRLEPRLVVRRNGEILHVQPHRLAVRRTTPVIPRVADATPRHAGRRHADHFPLPLQHRLSFGQLPQP